MKFKYTDGTNQFSNEQSRWEVNYATKLTIIQHSDKLVTKIEVWIKNGGNGNSTNFSSRANDPCIFIWKYAIFSQSAKRVDIQNNLFRDWPSFVIVFTLQLHPPMDYL